MATAIKTLVTAEEFLQMDLGEGIHELVRGEIVQIPPGGPDHGVVCANVAALLHQFSKRTGHGYAMRNDSAVLISSDTVRGGDVLYYSEARIPRVQIGPRPTPIAPDLVVEVYSPSDPPTMMMEK